MMMSMKSGALRFTNQQAPWFYNDVERAFRKEGQTMNPFENHTVLMVDDDPDDRFLACNAFRKSGLQKDFQTVADGEELMDYLYGRGKFTNLGKAALPCLILLDLNMPRKDGREVLREMKGDPDLRGIPIVVFTTSNDESDIASCYELGAKSYITKPAKFDRLVEVMTSLEKFWLKVAQLPDHPNEHISEQPMS
jgi:CheY-like chemotaxis protein